MATYNLLAYGGTGLGYNTYLGDTFVADTSQTAHVVAQDDDAILNDWTTGNYNGTSTPGMYEGDTNSTVISSEIPWLTSGDMITSGIWLELSYTDPDTGLTGNVDVFTIWDDTDNEWGGSSGSYVFVTAPLIDGVTYTVIGGTGNGGVPWDVLICFARGTRILTPSGEVAVEDLSVDNEVVTLDSGGQKIRWIGHRSVPAKGKHAPVEIRAGSLGNQRDLMVSPNHRMMISSEHAELLFGNSEVLVAAKDLVNDNNIRIRPGGDVEYFHILLDKHEIIYAEGALTESFHPGEQSLTSFSEDTREEIFDLFPELRGDITAYPAARASLKSYEASILKGILA